jgi:curved DNA-binding protein CbpA
MVDDRDAYDVLHVDPGAEPEAMAAAYRALARRFHPDGTTPSLERMIEVNVAYDKIRTPERRAGYDRSRRPPVAVGPGAPDPAARWPGPLARRIDARRVDSPVIDFGRYEGWQIAELARHDPEYLRWLSRHSSGIRYRDAIARYLPGDGAIGRRAGIIY